MSSLAAPIQRVPPQPAHSPTERAQSAAVPGHAVVAGVPAHHGTEVPALFRDRVVQVLPQGRFNLTQFRLHPLAHRLPADGVPPLTIDRTGMRETEKIEARRLTLASSLPVDPREAAKLDQSSLVRM